MIRIISFLYIIPITVFFSAYQFRYDWLVDAALALFFANGLINILLAFYSKSSKWILAGLQVLVLAGGFIFLSMLFLYAPPDFYGAHKDLPPDITIDQPLDGFPIFEHVDSIRLAIVNSIQPGIYYYATNYAPSEPGSIYIKVYEMTSLSRLSEKSITESSTQIVLPEDSTYYSKEFTIYEGSWGDEYGARIELWFKPQQSKSETLIVHSNYVVEGWMR